MPARARQIGEGRRLRRPKASNLPDILYAGVFSPRHGPRSAPLPEVRRTREVHSPSAHQDARALEIAIQEPDDATLVLGGFGLLVATVTDLG